MPRVRHILALAAIAAAALVVAACNPAPRQDAQPASPGERGPGTGMAMTLWVVDDSPLDDVLGPGEVPRSVGAGTIPIAAAFRPYVDRPVPVPPATLQLWRANGLRVVSVPVRDIEKLQAALRLVGPVQHQWLGEAPRWVEAVSGASWSGPLAISLDNGPLRLDSGALRLLMRCWVAPGAIGVHATDPAQRLATGPIAGAIQVELVPQHVEPVRAEIDERTLLPKPRATPEAAGIVLSRLMLEANLSGQDALVIVPERSDAQWKPATPPEGETAGNEPQLPVPASMGPGEPVVPTLGEAMLSDITATARRGQRVIVVLIPRPPRAFNLLGQ